MKIKAIFSTSLILSIATAVVPTFAFALTVAGQKVVPPGCTELAPITGRFACDAGEIDIVKGFVNVNGRRECAFIEPVFGSSELFVEIDNPNAEFTDQYVCHRL